MKKILGGILLGLIIFIILIYRGEILNMFGVSYRTIYNKKISIEDMELLEENLEIVDVKYSWNEEVDLCNEPTILVYHHTAIKNISPLEIDKLHKNKGWKGIGYHFYIRKDGRIFKGRDELGEGAHVKGYNKVSLGICVEGNLEEEFLTENQKKSIKDLSIYLCLKYNIKDIVSHKNLGNTLCPGKNFPRDEIKGSVIEGIKNYK